MIAGCLKRIGQPPVNRLPVMEHFGGLPVHGHTGANDDAAIDLTYALVSQTYPKNGDLAAEALYHLVRYSGVVRPAGPRRNNYVRGLQGCDIINCYTIVALYDRLPAQFPKVLCQVVHK